MDPTEAQVKAAKEAYELAKMKSMEKQEFFLQKKCKTELWLISKAIEINKAK